MKNESEKYTGVSELEIMSLAKNYNDFLLKLVKKSAGQATQILDFGAGTGTFAVMLRNSGKTVVCIESDIDLQNRLKINKFEVYGDLDEIQVESLDFIYSLNVFEHIENHETVMNELYKRLKPGAKVFIYLPAFQALYSSMDKKVGHFRRYNKKMLKELVTKSGFKINSIGYADSVGFFVSIMYKLIGSANGEINPKALVFFDRYLFPINIVSDFVVGFFVGKNVWVDCERNN